MQVRELRAVTFYNKKPSILGDASIFKKKAFPTTPRLKKRWSDESDRVIAPFKDRGCF